MTPTPHAGNEVVADTAGAVGDPAGVVGVVERRQPGVELCDRGDLRDGDEMGAAEPAALALHPALLVGALDARAAVERVEAVVGAELHPAVGLLAVAAEQHP